MRPELVRHSRYLSFLLRHDPGAAGLVLDTAAMAAAGHVFHLSDTGIWLTDHVPARFIREMDPA